VVLAGAALYQLSSEEEVDYEKVADDIRAVIASAGPKYDDGSYGPLLVRLAWHCAGSYSKHDKTGGSQGAGMRFPPESDHGGNAGLHIARNLLEPIKKKYPGITYADLYTLAGTIAIAELNGPRAKWRPGRSDFPAAPTKPTPDGRLPDAAQGAKHVRDVFYRMGFSDQETVALLGAHALGRCHKDRSGFEGPWTNSPTMFTNDFYRLLLEQKWSERKWGGPRQYQDGPNGKLMMLPTDMGLVEDPDFRHWVKVYAEDEDLFFKDFAAAWTKLMELGVDFTQRPKSPWSKLFG
jgi:cytochrome c peroxidase